MADSWHLLKFAASRLSSLESRAQVTAEFHAPTAPATRLQHSRMNAPVCLSSTCSQRAAHCSVRELQHSQHRLGICVTKTSARSCCTIRPVPLYTTTAKLAPLTRFKRISGMSACCQKLKIHVFSSEYQT